MDVRRSILCPVDFSPASLAALRHAIVLANYAEAALTVTTVDDGLLAEVGDARMGAGWARANSERELRSFFASAGGVPGNGVTFSVGVGKAAPEIVRLARDGKFDLIVMSTHGRSGVQKWFFGATAERVLRETTVPVLLVPPLATAAVTFDGLARAASPILAPVDFSAATAPQIHAAGLIAARLHARLLVGHVVQPIRLAAPDPAMEAELLTERHRRACRSLEAIAVAMPAPVAPEIMIAAGEPPDEIARWVQEKHVGLLVMALHDDVDGGPRLGSVTYRTISATRVMTLALPPARPS